MFRVGVDSTKFSQWRGQGADVILRKASELGLDGVYFRSILELSAGLDAGELRDRMALAAELGLYVEAGVGKVNPYATPEAPAIRALGDGDYLAAMTRMIEAAANVGVHELWTATANYQFRFTGINACDRFRTDVSWADQLAATERFLHTLAPVLRASGTHLNMETHEEITTFELVRLVEAVGPDVIGITFDSANVLVRCEDPIAALRRAAPYVRATHIRDVALFFTPEGIARIQRPVGDGVIDWAEFVGVLRTTGANVSIEGVIEDSRGRMDLQLYDSRWLAGHPDLTAAEAIEVVRLTRENESRVARGEAPGLEALSQPVSDAESLDFILTSAARIRAESARLDAAETMNEGAKK